MKRKLLCCFLVFSIFTSLLAMEGFAIQTDTCLQPDTAFSQEAEIISDESQLAAACTAGGSYRLISDITLTQELPKITTPLIIFGDDKTISPVLTGLDEHGVVQLGSTFPIFQVSSTGTLTLSQLTVIGGSSTAIKVKSEGKLTTDNVVITRSGSSNSEGGGINNNGTVIMRNSAITRCVARYGGGFVNNGKMVMDSCSVTENRNIGGRSMGGGGCENNMRGLLILNNCTFSNNQSTEIGGAINNYSATLYVLNSTITGNISYNRNAYDGGGIGINGGNVTVVNSILANNYAYSKTGKPEFVGSDIGCFSGDHAAIYHSYVQNYIHSFDQAPPVIFESTVNATPAYNIFSDYRNSNMLNADGTDSPLGPFLRPVVTMLDNRTYGAPLADLDDFVRSGCPLYLEYDSSANLIALAYGESPNYLVGNSGGALIDTYQGGSYRTPEIRGALGPTGDRFYTVRLIQGQGGSATGATVFGDSRAVGTPTRLTATPLEGNYLEYWESSPDNITWTPLAGGNILLYSGSGGEVTFLRPKFSADGHRLTYTSSENTITQSCEHCHNSAVASLSHTEREYLYTGQAICPSRINTDSNWIGGPPLLTYLNNTAPGTATVTMSINDVVVSAYFRISSGLRATAVWENLNQVYGDGKAVRLTLQGIHESDDCSLELSSPAPSTAGSHALTAQLTGKDKEKYYLSNPRATLTILPASVIFAVENNSLLWDGNSKSATISATANGLSYSDYTINYLNSAGETVTPTDVGDYTIIATLTNGNYRHSGSEGGGGRPIGMFSIYSQAAPSYYRLAFDGGNSIGTVPVAKMLLPGTPVILPEGTTLNNPGYQFAGWQSENKTYRSGDAFTMPDRNVTFTALWQPTYEISGIIGYDKSPVEGVTVTLMLGSETISNAITDSNGKYSFMNVIPGVYNLVASFDGIIITTKTTVADKNVENLDIVLPEGRTNSVVEVKPGVIPVVVGNLEKVFDQQQIYTQEDKLLVVDGGSIEVRLTVSSSQIPQEFQGQTGLFTPGMALELVANKTAMNKNGERLESLSCLLEDTGILLEHRIPLEARLQGKSDYRLFRLHNGNVQELTTTPNSDGEYITYNEDKTVITLFSRYYSIFTIAYKDSSAAPAKPETAFPFTDVPTESYFYEDIKYMYEEGLMVGISETTFSPHESTSRAMLTTILWRMAGKPQAETPSDFTDINLDAYYGEALSWGQENLIVKGYGEGLFGPKDPITREQLAAILYRYSGETHSGGSLKGFADGHTASGYATEALCWAVETGILQGKPGLRLDPKAHATRGEAAVMLARYIRQN